MSEYLQIMQDVDSYWDDERCRMHRDAGKKRFKTSEDREERCVNGFLWDTLRPKGFKLAKMDEEGNLYNVDRVKNGELYYVRCNGLVAKVNNFLDLTKKTMHELITTNDEMLGPWYCDIPIISELPDPVVEYLVRMIDEAKSRVGVNVKVVTFIDIRQDDRDYYSDDGVDLDWDSDETEMHTELARQWWYDD
jgi:hypothetical protein